MSISSKFRPAGALEEEAAFCVVDKFRFEEKGKELNFHMPFETNKTEQRDSSEISHISSLATSPGCQQGRDTGKGAKLVTAVKVAGEGRGQEPFH